MARRYLGTRPAAVTWPTTPILDGRTWPSGCGPQHWLSQDQGKGQAEGERDRPASSDVPQRRLAPLPPEGLSSWIPQSQSVRAGQSIFPWVRCGWCGGVRTTTRRSSSTGTSSGCRCWRPSAPATDWTGRSLACPAARSTWRLSVWPAHGSCPRGWISWCSTCLMPPPRSRSRHGWPLRAWTRCADRLLERQRRRHLPGPRRAGSSVRVLDLPPAHLTREGQPRSSTAHVSFAGTASSGPDRWPNQLEPLENHPDIAGERQSIAAH